MEFNDWLKAKGFDPATLSDTQRAALTAAWRAEQNPAAPEPAKATATQTPEPKAKPPESASFEDKMAAIAAESERIEYIREATTKAMESHVGNADKLKQLRELCDAAIADKRTTKKDFDLSLLRLDRMLGPIIVSPQTQQVNAQILEAAVCQTLRVNNVEKQFPDQVLQAAHSRFKRGISLLELLGVAAERNNGYRGSSRDHYALCKAAFGGRARAGYDGYDMMAVGPTTIDVSGILSNVANKMLAESFNYVEMSWRDVAQIKPAKDFKTMTTYRLTGANKFEKVAPGGEIKHGELGELSYTNRIDTYGKLLGIDRRDLINDDLGAFAGATRELGRGAGDSLNEVFWTEFLSDSAFFPTDKSLGNYDDGATDSVLSLAGLENADLIFAQQTKPDGTPLGVMPAILLVPRGLRATAMTLMSATNLVGQGQSAAPVPDGNPWAGMFRVVSSVYLGYTSLGGSATAWYLLADPNNVPVIQVAFLNGVETPTVETGEFDFDRLGLALRAYMDFGCAKQEYRGGVKLKGAA